MNTCSQNDKHLCCGHADVDMTHWHATSSKNYKQYKYCRSDMYSTQYCFL